MFIIGGSQWGDGFYGHRLKFCPFYSSRLTPLRPSDRRFVLLLTLSQIGRGWKHNVTSIFRRKTVRVATWDFFVVNGTFHTWSETFSLQRDVSFRCVGFKGYQGPLIQNIIHRTINEHLFNCFSSWLIKYRIKVKINFLCGPQMNVDIGRLLFTLIADNKGNSESRVIIVADL